MRFTALIPVFFVLIWPTGFVGAKFGLPYAEPLTFLALRFGIAAGVLAMIVLLWPTPRLARHQISLQVAIGILVHGLYLGGVFVAIHWGLEAWVSALILGLQPIATAFFARFLLGERLVAVQWAGMVLGLMGVALIIVRKVEAGLGTPAAFGICTFGLVAIALGAVLQKRQAQAAPMVAGNAVQFAAASLLCALGAFVFETREIRAEPEFFLALGWMVIVLSFVAITLLYLMIRAGGASQVASLFFLVPPLTALYAWGMFGETLGWIEAAGMALACLGVLMVNRGAPKAAQAAPTG
ncbi:MAG: DMT family transporter [Pseudomonadota bacterium]